MTEGGGGRRSRVPKVGTCCCLLPLEPGVTLIAFAELIICAGLFLYTLLEEIRGPTFGPTPAPGEVLHLRYTALLDVIFAIYLLVGVYFKKPHYAKFWSAVQSAHLLVSVMLTAYRLGTSEIESKKVFAKVIIENAITICIDAYFILVVYSYYRECKKALIRNTSPEIA